jgi:glyoxylase-like metal-dependent hydrolase (beta-lactamase superfamily II)
VGAAEALRNSTQSERFFPHLLLQQARQAEVVTLSDQGFRYKDASGQLIEVRLDPATNRPLSAAMIVEDRRQTEWTYLDYQPRHGIQLPLRTEVRQAGRLQERLQLGATDLGRADPALLQPPSEYTAPPAGAPPALREAAPGVFFFEGMLGGYSSMAIETNDYFVIFEAPSGAEYAALQKRLLGERRPGKEVKYVLVTHHHGDHTGGVKAWHDLGATIVVAAGATPALERQLRARGGTGDFRIEEVGAHRRFGSGANAIDTYAFSNAHAASNLLMHLPGHRILFQGDMYAAPVRGPLPAATPLARVLAQQIAQRKLNVSLIVAVHGRPVTMAELRTAISMPTASPAS